MENKMTEEAKKRMEELEDAMVQHWRENFKTTADGYGLKRYGFKRGYEAGMQDPEAGKDSLAVANLVHADEKIRELQVAYKGLLEENKKLREALDFALPELERLNCDAPINLSKHTGQVLINIRKALSTGGEK